MIYALLFFQFFLTKSNMEIFDFTQDNDLSNWRVVDDVVMGGRSDGAFEINEMGNGVFQGVVSLENNGGFSSLRYRFDQKEISGYKAMVIRLKGDGKRYQVRAKSDGYERHSYIYYFQTTGEWQTVEVPLQDMIPTFRGRKLNMPNYPAKAIAEVAFLIGNKKAESFRLELDRAFLK